MKTGYYTEITLKNANVFRGSRPITQVMDARWTGHSLAQTQGEIEQMEKFLKHRKDHRKISKVRIFKVSKVIVDKK